MSRACFFPSGEVPCAPHHCLGASLDLAGEVPPITPNGGVVLPIAGHFPGVGGIPASSIFLPEGGPLTRLRRPIALSAFSQCAPLPLSCDGMPWSRGEGLRWPPTPH